ncbi:MAG TPA: site-specific integrase, partial [Coxiellaceae bacterium]|nr:site-specific integrase [Coxiellaceae bacterium]
MSSKNTTAPTPLFDTLDHLAECLAGKELHPDSKQALEFLYSYRGSEATFNSYRRELERFLQWLNLIEKKTLAALGPLDVENYLGFCQNPPLNWIGQKQVARFITQEGQRIPNPEWRPFVATVSKTAARQGQKPDPSHYQLSQKAIQAIFSVLGSFFNFLIDQNYLNQNPVARIRQKSKFIRKQQGRAPVRRLSEFQWSYVIGTVESMAASNPEHERSLFIMTALYAMYLRISELTVSARWQPKMGDFAQDSEGNWWFTTVGKGNKERI